MACAFVLVTSPRALADKVDVHVSGIDDPLKTNVEKSLSVAAEHKKPWSADQIQRLFRLAPKQIKQALQPYGYFNPDIQESLDRPGEDAETWQAHFNIEHGPPTKITRLHMAAQGPGRNLEAVQKALQDTQLKEGERLVEPKYSSTKDALYDAAYSAGYLDAKFTQSAIRVNPTANSAEIDLVLDTGRRYFFGPVTFDQDLLNDKFVHRFVPFEPGQPYDAEKLVDLQMALSESDYFSQIDIEAPRSAARHVTVLDPWFYDLLFPVPKPTPSSRPGMPGLLEIPVTVTAKPSKSQSYKVSLGYGTDTGPRVGFGVKFRHLNQYGHQFRADLRVSQIERTLHSSYDIPIKDVTQDKLSFTGTISNQDYGDITSTLYGLGVTRDTGWSLGRKQLYFRVDREYYNIGAGDRHSTLLYPGYRITLQKADNMMFTHQGVSLSADLRGGSNVLGSSTDFVRADLAANAVYSFTSDLRLVMRSRFGAISASDFSAMPPSQRFFAGGARSVRGYGYEQISPTNSHGDHIGGKFLAVGSIEGDWFFYKKFGAAVFFDMGDVENRLSDFDFKRGVGIGFRWASPVGMVRLDVAHPLNDSRSSFRIHFSLGPDL